MPKYSYPGSAADFRDNLAAIRAAVRADREAMALRQAEQRGDALLAARLAGKPAEGVVRPERTLALRAGREI